MAEMETRTGMSTLVMVRMVCCESYKECGTRCSICPNRPENMDAAERCRAACERMSLGCRIGEASRRPPESHFQTIALEPSRR